MKNASAAANTCSLHLRILHSCKHPSGTTQHGQGRGCSRCSTTRSTATSSRPRSRCRPKTSSETRLPFLGDGDIVWTGDLPDVATHDDVVGQCWMVSYASPSHMPRPIYYLGIQSNMAASLVVHFHLYHHCPFGLLPVEACERPRRHCHLSSCVWCALECDRGDG